MKRDSFTLAIIKCLALLVLIAAPLAAQSKKDKEQAKKFQEDGDKAYGLKDYKGAAEAYDKSVLLIPSNSYVHYRKGFAHFNLKENDKAITELTLALTQGYKPPVEIYRIRYFIYFEQRNFDAALADIQKGLELTPNDINFLSATGEIYFARQSYTEALAAYKKASLAAPNNADIFYNIARVYFAANNAKEQAAAAEAALAKGTRFPGETHYLLGDAYQKLRNPAGAIEEFQKAISSRPDNLIAYRNLAEAYRSENRYNDAIAISKKGLQQFGANGNIYTDLSWFYSLADRPNDAIEAAKAGISLLPSQSFAYTQLCRAYNDIKSFDQAIGACNSALKLNPGDGETYFYLGRAYNLSGKTVEATKYYGLAVKGLEEYTKKNETYSDGWYLLGNAYYADGQRDKATTSYRECLKWSPKFAKARYNLGIIYTLMKNKPGASEQYTALVRLDAKLAEQLKAAIDKM